MPCSGFRIGGGGIIVCELDDFFLCSLEGGFNDGGGHGTRGGGRERKRGEEVKKRRGAVPERDKISAYYSLVFPHFTFYVQTLSITIGRRCVQNPSAPTSSTAEQQQVDVDLGALKSVSRLHAKIEYDQEEDRFVLVVVGRNGAWVDGVWSASGTRAPLGERSQIQIASRVFHFVLPPPPPPDDTPSPSSQSSANRARSPSVDITSISPPVSPPSSQPSHSPPLSYSPPPPSRVKVPPLSPTLPPASDSRPQPQPQLPNSNQIGKSNKNHSKKRKKGEHEPPPVMERPKPEDIPPKPQATYAQLIYRAIKALGGKATLQEICTWISNTHPYYQYADSAWMSSVRHNLSSGRAFLKMERCGGDRGKGFFWSIDEKNAHALEEQESRSQQQAASGAQGSSGGKDGAGKGGSRKKDKASLLEPPLRRSVKDVKGAPLPPPLTSTPLPLKNTVQPATTSPSATQSTAVAVSVTNTTNPIPSTSGLSSTTPAATGIFAYPTHPHHVHPVTAPQQKGLNGSGATLPSQNPYAALAQPHWTLHSGARTINVNKTPAPFAPTTASPTPTPAASATPSTANPTPTPTTPNLLPTSIPTQSSVPGTAPPRPPPGNPTVPDVVIPIVLGPIPPTHPDYSPTHPNNSKKEGYMVLHERKLILDPDVFSGLTKEMLVDLEKMGARAALGKLTDHMIRALKERRARGRGKDRGARKARGTGRGGAARKLPPGGSPFTNTPLERRTVPSGASSGSGVAVAETPDILSNVQSPPPVAAPVAVPICAPMHSLLSPTTVAPPPAFTATQLTLAENTSTVPTDPGSPIIIVDDSDSDGPATKRRKVEEGTGAVAAVA
ncbi:hypothetical protein BDQ17DRAFT_1397936 [Cyathus striatus]|nr:hypothetical protein BDQ17DRAFT_1397936 [Cyathus striatus]